MAREWWFLNRSKPRPFIKIHEGHQGITTRCQCGGLSYKCPKCARDAKPSKEPLIPTSLPAYPWQKVSTDLFHLHRKDYIVVVDYFSHFPEVKRLKSTTTQGITDTLKAIFARYGIQEVLRSDNGPQFNSQEFTQFAEKYNFKHVTSSPHFPASNGQTERAAQTVKNLLKNSKDPLLAYLASYSTTMVWNITSLVPRPLTLKRWEWPGDEARRSPAELLMGGKIRTTLPMSEWPYLKEFQQSNEKFKKQQKTDYDRRHRVHDLPEIPDNTDVWVKIGGHPIAGRTVTFANTPRSYVVQTPTGEMRRNRRQLNIAPPTNSHSTDNIPQTDACTKKNKPVVQS